MLSVGILGCTNSLPYTSQNATEEYNGSSWTNGGNMGTARYTLAGFGTQTAGVVAGGRPKTGATEEYNGSSWTAGGTMATARFRVVGAGIETAGLAFGGTEDPPTTGATEKYDGSSWTSASDMLTVISGGMGSAGTQTAALGFGGGPTGGAFTQTQEFGLFVGTETLTAS